MLKRLFRPKSDPAHRPAAIPTGERVYAVGDIHGRDDLLERLLDTIAHDDAARAPARTTLIFLGDLIDRGPDSARVIERLRHLAARRPDTRFLLGNHEEMLLGALDGEKSALKLFCRVGGRETMLSYGIDELEYERVDYVELAELLDRAIPVEHRAFLGTFEHLIEVGDYAFVHAGVNPAVSLADQRQSDLRWIRKPFLDHDRPLEKVIVHGHTVSDEPEFRAHRLGIDTGAFATGRLTAVGLEGADRWILTATDEAA